MDRVSNLQIKGGAWKGELARAAFDRSCESPGDMTLLSLASRGDGEVARCVPPTSEDTAVRPLLPGDRDGKDLVPFRTMRGERLANRMRHLAKWGRRQGISCFRLYERDVPEYPAIVDSYADIDPSTGAPVDLARAGAAVAWLFRRKKDETPEQERAHRLDSEAEILAGLDIPRERLFVKHRGRQVADDGGREQYERVGDAGRTKVIAEHGLKFEVNLTDFLDVGLFLDHRPTRLSVQQRSQGRRILNLFAYTGAFSVHARAGGAVATTTVDMSKTYLDWYARNLGLNGFALDADHRSVHADCLQWLEAGPSSESERYDLVVCDPPPFSNSKRMKASLILCDIQRLRRIDAIHRVSRHH